MIIFILLLIGFFLFFRPKVSMSVLRDNPSKKPLCPPHTWTYKNLGDENEYMVCETCKMLPGGQFEENNS